jgi:hypothetical protein
MVTGSTAGFAQRLRLDRAARNAGEAFAFVEPGTELRARRRSVPLGGIVGAFVALAVLTVLYFGS